MRWFALWVICLVALCVRPAPAQDPAAPSRSSFHTPSDTAFDVAAGTGARRESDIRTAENKSLQTQTAPGQVEEIEPPVYYVRDKEGRLVPMFGFRFEDFMRAFKQLRGLQRENTPPRFVIEKMSAEGSVTGKTARLSLRIFVRLNEAGSTRVPLGLDTVVVKLLDDKSPQPIIEYSDRDGYLAWLKGEEGAVREISLEVLAPLQTIGGETILRLQSPRAIESELRLTVPKLNQQTGTGDKRHAQPQLRTLIGRVCEGTILETTEETKSVLFVAQGVCGDFELAWRDSNDKTSQLPTVLTAIGHILSRIDEHSVNTEATLEVSGNGRPFDHFLVRLPPGAVLRSSNPQSYTVTELPPDPPKKDAVTKNGKTGSVRYQDTSNAFSLVEIRLPEKTLGPVAIRLATRQAHGQENAGGLIELSGFEVLGAARQWGHIALAIADDIHVSWNQQYHVRQVEDLPEILHQEDVVSGFAYSSQPCSLKAWVVPRKTRLSVEPEHVIFVDGTDVRLEATFRYMVRGKKAFLLDVDLADWELDEVGPPATVAVDGLDVDKNNVLRMPLLRRSAGKFPITLKAHRRLPAKIKNLQLRLPAPIAATSSSAAVAIQPADNIELIPNDDANVALTRQQVSSIKRLPVGYQQRPLLYRGDAKKVIFKAERSVHSRKVTVDVDSRILLDTNSGLVRQRFSYRIEYQPLRFLEINVPAAISGSELEFEIGGQKVSPLALAQTSSEDKDTDTVNITIPLASPGNIGSLELVVKYPLHWQELPPRTSILRELPLVMPGKSTLLSNRLSIRAKPPLTVGIYDESWTLEAVADTPSSQRTELVLSNSKTSRKAMVAIHCQEGSQHESTVVDKAWICTDLTGSVRQDRAFFSIFCDKPNLHITLPPNVEHADVAILLDGESALPKQTAKNQLLVPLSVSKSHKHLLELCYHFSEQRPLTGQMQLDLPHVGNDAWNRRIYWELILPHNEHVILNPSNFVSEYIWDWNGFFWGQEPICSRDYLADWIGVHRQSTDVEFATQLPSDPRHYGTNRYLFSSFGRPKRCEIHTLGRSWLVLLSSAAALIAGLALIYVPVARHPLMLSAVGIVILSLCLIFPAATLLLLQAAALGIVLAILAMFLARFLPRRWHGRTILKTGSSILDIDSTQAQRITPSGQVQSTDSMKQEANSSESVASDQSVKGETSQGDRVE